MNTHRFAMLAISAVPFSVSAVAAEEISFWEQRTCHTHGASRICNTLNLRFWEDWAGPGSGLYLIGHLRGTFPNPILPSAIGVVTTTDLGFSPDPTSSPGGWVGGPPSRWTLPSSRRIAFAGLGAYSIATGIGATDGIEHWWAVLEGQAGDLFEWKWDGPLVANFLFVWRGESEDGSVDFDCWQNPNGGEDCLSTVPEPSTTALLLTGITALAVAVKLRRTRTRS